MTLSPPYGLPYEFLRERRAVARMVIWLSTDEASLRMLWTVMDVLTSLLHLAQFLSLCVYSLRAAHVPVLATGCDLGGSLLRQGMLQGKVSQLSKEQRVLHCSTSRLLSVWAFSVGCQEFSLRLNSCHRKPPDAFCQDHANEGAVDSPKEPKKREKEKDI